MASKQSTVDYLLDQMALAGPMTAKRMFGEFGVYLDGKIVALVCDDQLFVKPTEGGRRFIGTPEEGFAYPGAKASFLISGDRFDDSEWLCELIRVTARELPDPKPKVAKVPKTSKVSNVPKVPKVLKEAKAAEPPKSAKAKKPADGKASATPRAKLSGRLSAKT